MNKNKTTHIYIDASNIIKGLDSYDFDTEKFITYLKDVYRTENIKYFVPYLGFNIKDIQRKDLEVIIKETCFENKKLKANCDVEISHHITKDIKDGMVDKIVICSGDGYFAILYKYCINNNINIKISSPTPKCTSKYLRKRYNDKIQYINNIGKDKFIK